MLIEATKAPALLKQAPKTFRADDGLVVHPPRGGVDRRRAHSLRAGRPPGETGDAPVHLNGYGGFGVSSEPH